MLRAWYRFAQVSGGVAAAKRRFRHKCVKIALYGVFCDSVYGIPEQQ